MYQRIALVFTYLIFIMPAFTQSAMVDTITKRRYEAIRVEQVPKIDGILDDECWKLGTWSAGFTQQIPHGGSKPSQETELNIVYDYEYLYLAIKCHDTEPEKMRAVFAPRDEFMGDCAGVAFDSYYDKRTAFEFNVTAAGQKIDIKHVGDFMFDHNWNAIWEGKTTIGDSGWYAEMKVPFSQLRYSLSDSMIWGLHCWRWIDRNHEEDQWQLIPKDAPSAVYLFGELAGIKDIRPSRQIEILPYGVSKYTLPNSLTENPYGSNDLFKISAGFDAKIGLTSNIILDATVNPDFGQVEADPSELNLTAFETFFQEKRGFFNEGIEIYNYDLSDNNKVLYTRRIGQKPLLIPDVSDDEFLDAPENSTILSSVKITGKTQNGLSLGILESVVNKETAGVYREDSSYTVVAEPLTNYFAGRVIKDYDEGNFQVGAIFTSVIRHIPDDRTRDEIHSSAHVTGIDFIKYFNLKSYYIKGKGAVSILDGSEAAMQKLQNSSLHYFQRPDADHLKLDSTITQLTGYGGIFEIGKNGGRWRFHSRLNFQSPGFNINDVGYLKQADELMNHSHLIYAVNKPTKLFREYYIHLYHNIAFDFEGRKTLHEIKSWTENQFHNKWGTSIAFVKGLASYDTRELRGGPALRTNNYWGVEMFAHTDWSKNISASMWNVYYRSNEDPTSVWVMEFGLNIYPVPKVRLGASVAIEKNDKYYKYIDTLTLNDDNYILGKLNQDLLSFTLRAEYYLNPELSIRFYGSPYLSIGKYNRFKFIEDAHALTFAERYHYIPDESLNYIVSDNRYEFAYGNSAYSFENPNFHYGQFRSNLVFRWEYKLGSVLYFVWSHDQTYWDNVPAPTLGDDYRELNRTKSTDILLVKFNYYFSL